MSSSITQCVVTRDQLKNFLNGEQLTSPLSDILSRHTDIRKEQLSALYNAGKSVCRIDINDEPMGTGFHYGNGWIVTCAHVICHGDEKTSSACCASFVFPEKNNDSAVEFKVLPKSREVIFTNISCESDEEISRDEEMSGESDEDSTCGSDEDIEIRKKYFTRDSDGKVHKLDEKHKDLALIKVPEVADEFSYGLVDQFQQPAKDRERVYLIHYGIIDIREEDHSDQLVIPPQQFSMGEAQYSERNRHGNTYTGHNAYCRGGSSGAPLLTFCTDPDQPAKLLVAGVHFAGDSDDTGSNGTALWFKKKYSIDRMLKTKPKCTQRSAVTGTKRAAIERQGSIDDYINATVLIIIKVESMNRYQPSKWTSQLTSDQQNEVLFRFKRACEELNDLLNNMSSRYVIPDRPPSDISQNDLENIIWKPECNHHRSLTE